MNKEQFIETLFNVVDKKIAEALVKEAESKGYFETNSNAPIKLNVSIDLKTMSEYSKSISAAPKFETSEYSSRRLISEKDLRKAVKLLSKFFENHKRVECFHYMSDCRLSDFVVKALSLDK